jgi:hypothetical protein
MSRSRSNCVGILVITLGFVATSTNLRAQQPATPAGVPARGESPYVPYIGHPTTTYAAGQNRSANMTLMAHLPLGMVFTQNDLDLEQEMSRPYAYMTRRYGDNNGVDVIDLKDINQHKARVLCSYRIKDSNLHQGAGALNPVYFKTHGKYYLVVTYQFTQGGPDNDLGADVLDVTGLPNCATMKKIGEIREPSLPGGFHEGHAYKHSSGAVLLLTTTNGPSAHIYDMDKFIAGQKDYLVGNVPVPEGAAGPGGGVLRSYHDFYIGYDPTDHKDKFYGAGAGGYYVYDITDYTNPKLISAVTGVQGMARGHTFTPDPLGRFAVLETEYQYAPLRLVDLKPNGKDNVPQINRTIGAFTPNWQNLPHNHEVRWPYVFVSAYEDGLHVFNMMDPTKPVTVAFYDTFEGPHDSSFPGGGITNGLWSVQVRNADGLIIGGDAQTGFWAFKMEGFDGWNGHDWGMPNISSAQDWDNGPDGAPKGGKPVT